MRTTDDPSDSRREQAEVYLVLSDEERAEGFVRPVRATYCARCNLHRPVGEAGEFEWLDGSKVGT